MRYHAFISYSHGADARLAPALQRALHRFAKPWWKARAVDVFRDETSLALAHSLPETLTRVLAASEHFVLLASPPAAASKWVAVECAWWAANKDPQRMLVVLTAGEIAWDEPAGDFDWARTTALPPVLKGVFKHEPLYLDLRWARAAGAEAAELFSDRDPRFLDAIARISAALRGMSLDRIAGEEVRQHRRTRRAAYAAVSAIALLAVAAGTGAWFGFAGQRRAERNLAQALQAADTLVTTARRYMVNVAGISIELRMKMLREAESVLVRLEGTGDSLRARQIRANLGVTIAENYRVLAEYERAERLAAAAIAALERLAAQAPRGPELAGDLAEAHQVHGEILRSRGANRGALSAYARSAAVVAPLVETLPDHDRIEDWKLTHLRALNGLGDVHFALREDRGGPCADAAACLAKARAFHAQALAIAKRSSDEKTKDFRWANGALVSQERLGRIYENTGQLDRARAAYEQALAAIQRIAEAAPENPKWRVNLMALRWSIGRVGERLCDTKGALAQYERSLEIAESLHALERRNKDWLSYLAQSLERVARAHWAEGAPDAATRRFRESAARYAELLDIQPEHPRWRAARRGIEEAMERLRRNEGPARPAACRK